MRWSNIITGLLAVAAIAAMMTVLYLLAVDMHMRVECSPAVLAHSGHTRCE